MAIKTPQDLQTVKKQALPTSRVERIAPEAMSANFLGTFAKAAETVIAGQAAQDKRMTSIISARYRELADQERIKSEGAVASVQGWNVLKTSTEQSTKLQESLKTLKSQFDEKYEPYLENVRLDVMNKFTRSSQPYVTSQVKKTTNDTYNAILSNEMNDTILDSGNLDNFSTNLDRIRGLVKEKNAIMRGEDENAEVAPGITIKEVQEKETETAVSKTVSNSVIQLSTLGNLKNAEELFRKHDADMNPDDRLRAVEAMKRAVSSEENKASIAMADTIQKSANDMVEAERMASDLAGTTKQRQHVMGILQNRYAIAEKASKKKEDDTTAVIYENLMQGKSLSDVNELLRSLSVKRQNEVVDTLNKNNGKVVPSTTNNAKFDEALTSVLTDPDVLEDPGFMARYTPHLNPSDFSYLKGKLATRKAQAADAQAWNRLNTNKITLDTVKNFNNEMGIFDPTAISKNKRIGSEYADSLLEANPKMDQLELKKKVKAFLFTNSAMPKVTERAWYSKAWAHTFGDGLDYSVNYGDPQAPDAIGEDGKGMKYSEEEINEFRRGAREAFSKQGKNVDMTAIEKALRKRMSEGKSLKIQ